MASQQKTVDVVLEQIAAAGRVAARKMFGEYGLYCDGRMVARSVTISRSSTTAGRSHIGQVTEAAPYQGAKPCCLEHSLGAK